MHEIMLEVLKKQERSLRYMLLGGYITKPTFDASMLALKAQTKEVLNHMKVKENREALAQRIWGDCHYPVAF